MMTPFLSLSISMFLNIPQADVPPEVEVFLGKKVETLKGKTWPKRDGRLPGTTAVDEACRAIIHLPSGQSVKAWSQNIWLSQEGGVVRAVEIMPLRQPLEFVQAVSQVEQLAQGFAIRDAKLLKETLARWKQMPPTKDADRSRSTKAQVEDDVYLNIEVKRDVDDKGWLVIMGFTIPKLDK
jgi:hypothetical protein